MIVLPASKMKFLSRKMFETKAIHKLFFGSFKTRMKQTCTHFVEIIGKRNLFNCFWERVVNYAISALRYEVPDYITCALKLPYLLLTFPKPYTSFTH